MIGNLVTDWVLKILRNCSLLILFSHFRQNNDTVRVGFCFVLFLVSPYLLEIQAEVSLNKRIPWLEFAFK